MAQESCAPPAEMCSQPSTNVSNSFVSYQFPLGLNFYDDADMVSATPQSIFLEFVVSVEDQDQKLSSQTAMLEIPLKEAGHVTWCEAETASADLLNVANVDIVIGTASSQVLCLHLALKCRIPLMMFCGAVCAGRVRYQIIEVSWSAQGQLEQQLQTMSDVLYSEVSPAPFCCCYLMLVSFARHHDNVYTICRPPRIPARTRFSQGS